MTRIFEELDMTNQSNEIDTTPKDFDSTVLDSSHEEEMRKDPIKNNTNKILALASILGIVLAVVFSISYDFDENPPKTLQNTKNIVIERKEINALEEKLNELEARIYLLEKG